MKLSSAMVERTLSQFQARPLPDNDPVVEQLVQLFGEHTFFLGPSGLHIVEPSQPTDSGTQRGVVVKVASWIDPEYTSLAPHKPEATDIVVVLDEAA
jgi:hypothetical protein